MDLQTKLAKIGKSDCDEGVLVDNTFLTNDEYQEQLSYLGIRVRKAVEKRAQSARWVWTWERQTSRYDPDGWTLVKTNQHYELSN